MMMSFTLPPAGSFDVVVIVGALSAGQVPIGIARHLCNATKPGQSIILFITFLS